MPHPLPARLLARSFSCLAGMLLALCATGALAASPPVLVKDINTLTLGDSSLSSRIVTVGDTAFFVGCDRTHGCELWRSDGTAGGTVRLKDIHPGTSRFNDPMPEQLVAVGSNLFFTASHPETGRELWKTDGTPEGTVLVKDINPGSPGSGPVSLTDVNGTLYFVAGDTSGVRRIWKSDGTAQGTQPFTSANFSSGTLLNFTVSGSLLYFSYYYDFTQQLWRTDGTDAGTIPLLVLPTDFSANSFIRHIEPLGGGNVVFGAPLDGLHRLWRSDGSPAGTTVIRDGVELGCGLFTVADADLGAVRDGVFYFKGRTDADGCELWRSDGTSAGTAQVYESLPGPESRVPRGLTAAAGTVFFLVEGSFPNTHILWKTDGTPAGTVLVRDFGHSFPTVSELTAFGNALLLSAGKHLWISNGTESGTVIVREFPDAFAGPSAIVAGATRAYFGVALGATGTEPWTTDATTAGTTLLKDIAGGTGTSVREGLTDVAGTLFFRVSSDLWRSDGTADATVPLPQATALATYFVGVMDEGYYFSSFNNLYRADASGVTLLANNLQADRFAEGSHAIANGLLFFPAGSSGTDYELWRTDGTAAGTLRVKDITPGDWSSGPRNFISTGDRVFFRTNSGELWTSDGTEAGTISLKAGAWQVSRVGNRALFTVSTALFDESLWVSDGTVAGTMQISAVPSAHLFVPAGPVTYFAVGTSGGQLWKTDGTAAGTAMVKSLSAEIASAALVGDVLYFFSGDPFVGRALWRSDGTSAGTFLLRSFAFGPSSYARVGSTLYFTPYDPAYGTEIWKSDGTPEGTVLAADLVPGTGDSMAGSLTVSGNKLFFTAQTEATAHELFMIAFDGMPDAFTFAGATGVAPGATVTSPPATVNGLEIQMPIRVFGGQYSLGCTGTFTSRPGIIAPGQSVCVRHVASATTDGDAVTTLRVGDYATSFTSRTVANVLTNPQLFAAQQYRDFLGREADAAGLELWANQIALGLMTQEQVIQAFFDSNEFQDGLPQLIRLYFAFFDRIPDYPGLLFHTGRYRAGVPVGEIAQDFAASDEFLITYGALDNGEYVDRVYRNVLGRAADPAGRANALAQLESGAMTRGQLMLAFSESQEHVDLTGPDVFVTSVYVGMLRRSPDPNGLENWINAFGTGMPRVQMLQAFLNSTEYRNRFLP